MALVHCLPTLKSLIHIFAKLSHQEAEGVKTKLLEPCPYQQGSNNTCTYIISRMLINGNFIYYKLIYPCIHALIDKIMKKILQIYEWLDKLSTKFFPD